MDDNKDDAEISSFDKALDAISDISIPAPIQKNLFKAINRLCTAAVEIPATYLENIAAEKKAESQARIKLIERSSTEIAEQMQFDPAYAKAAVRKFGERVIREQVNVDQIVAKATQTILNDPTNSSPEDSTTTISDDWLNTFEKEASQKSTQEMQDIFAKLLAGELTKPNSFSVKTIRLIGSLDQNTAELFQKLCSLCISHRYNSVILDARAPSLNAGGSGTALVKYGITFEALNTLNEYGLIIPDYHSWRDYSASCASSTLPIQLPIHYNNAIWGLIKKPNNNSTSLKVNGVSLTRSGRELMTIVQTTENSEFSLDLASWFDSQGLAMVPAIYPANP